MKLTIISPEKIVFEGEVSLVTVPGSKGPFEILRGHAPIISSMKEGKINYDSNGRNSLDIKGGFIEVADNKIVACVEMK